MKIELFGKTIQLRDHYCKLDDCPIIPIKQPYVNIYVNLTNACNANCKFCCNAKRDNMPFDTDKFKSIIQEIIKKVRINKISFTGGEPTLKPEVLSGLLPFVKNLDGKIFTVINTNGSNLAKIENCIPYLDSVALSRHHYDDDINQKIFCYDNIPSKNDIDKLNYKNKLHLSCNLLKDYISNIDEVINYLEFASQVGCEDVGFVSLMKINEFCHKQFVDFGDIHIEDRKNIFITKNWDFEGLCKCRNYIYISNSASVVSVYARHYISPEFNGSSLIFDGANLRIGFGGEIIC